MAEKKEEMDAPTTAPADKEEQGLDETVPGGVYIVNGQKVNANGEPLNKKDK